MMKRFALILQALVATISLGAQTPTWGLDFESVFDNREGDGNMTSSKTYFFTRLAPEVGLRLSDESRIAGGVVWYQPIGCEWEGHRISPTLYYRYEGTAWRFSMGMFPRKQLREEMPGFLWSDSMAYHQANIRGALVQYVDGRSFMDAYLDWRGMQTRSQREAFNIVAHAQWHPRPGDFFVGAHAMMNHLARRAEDPDDQDGVVDNFVFNPYVGIDLGRRAVAMDSLMIRGGAVVNVDRDRKFDNRWRVPVGGWLEVMARYRWLGVKNTLYAGGKLFPHYSTYGPLLYQGEPYFQSSFYNRTDLYLYILSRREVNLTAALDFNAAKGSFEFYQRLILTVSLDALTFRRKTR